MTDDELLAALATVQARGAIGEPSLPRAVEHAEQFALAIPASATSLVDLGSGGGLPGLVIAVRRPDLTVMLVERRTNRADLLRRAVAALGLTDRVTVAAEDVEVVASELPRHFDVVTARSFAAPSITAHWASALLSSGGLLIVSEPPDDDPDRWPSTLLSTHHLHDQGRRGPVRLFRRE